MPSLVTALLTCQKFSHTGSIRPFKGQELITMSSKKWSKVLATGGFTLKLCSIKISTSRYSTTKPNSNSTTPICTQPKPLVPSVPPGWKEHDFCNRFCIWQAPCANPPTSELTMAGRQDTDVLCKGEHDVIDLTVEDSSSNDEELQWGLTPFEN